MTALPDTRTTHLLDASEHLHQVLGQLLLRQLAAGQRLWLGVQDGLHYIPVDIVPVEVLHRLSIEQLAHPAPSRKVTSLAS